MTTGKAFGVLDFAHPDPAINAYMSGILRLEIGGRPPSILRKKKGDETKIRNNRKFSSRSGRTDFPDPYNIKIFIYFCIMGEILHRKLR